MAVGTRAQANVDKGLTASDVGVNNRLAPCAHRSKLERRKVRRARGEPRMRRVSRFRRVNALGRFLATVLLPVVLLVTAPGAQASDESGGSSAPVVGTAQDRADIDARQAFGLPVDSDTMQRLADSRVDVGTDLWGIPLTADEETQLAIGDRMAFADSVSERLLPEVRSLPTYGGAWIDQPGGGGLVIALTDLDSSVTAQIAALTPAATRGVRIQLVSYPRSDLEKAAREVSEAFLPEAAFGVVAVGIDDMRNSVRLYVSPASARTTMQTLPQLEREFGVPFTLVEQDRGNDVTCTSRVNCYDPYKPGIRINEGAVNGEPPCTLAFFIYQGTDKQVLTAGHCGHWGNTWYHPGIGGNTNPTGQVGSVQASQYHAGGRDILRMSVFDWEASETVYPASNPYNQVIARDPVLNEAVCASMAISDIVDCGTVSATTSSWKSETEMIWVNGADTTGIAPIIGDSGSPVYASYSIPAKPGVPAHTLYAAIGVLDHEKGYFARVLDSLDAWGATICC